jgi:hypothetical protein
MNLLQEIEDDFKAIFEKVKEEVEGAVLSEADKVVNMLMAFDASPTGEMIISGLETIFPAADPAIDAISLALPVIAKDMNWAQAEAGKSDDAIFQDAWTYLKNAVGNTKASQLNSLSAQIGDIINGIKEGTLTFQQLLSFAQGAHAPLIAI